ncbi:DUF6777 domain-containing protein [Streptomyces omiyaensis]|uniref:DUF6777 domain-containing protein n=1 Tax=Streptomyces omiyaensis TaxID=68247 RepID=A0ABW7BUQ7_9ACTN|nr:DUF6777 domain-containing protein [Streptomyces omiyaensis]GGY41708.1 hypothetical protein GCM10010363_23230 [Streptomyces omiyaensis]
MRPTQRRTRSRPAAVRPAPGAAPRQGRTAAVTATLGAAALFLAGCSAAEPGGAAGRAALGTAHEVHLQPVAAQGPDPFTASTARGAGLRALQEPGADAQPVSAPGIREVTGSTPGLYGGTRAEGSCDVEQQVAYLAAEPAKLTAFAEAAGIPEGGVADWLRDLTPVLLRADTRVTNHGFRDGRASAFQSVLQAGTAVLVDPYGAPRVRCACGNPLRTPVSVSGAVHHGDPWAGFDPDRVIIVKPTSTVVNSLVIVNVSDDSWIERKAGSDGDQDRKPDTVPDCDPDTCALSDPVTPDTGTEDPDASADATPGTPTERPAAPTAPDAPAAPDTPAVPQTPAAPDTPAPPTAPDAPPPSPTEPDAPADPYAEPPSDPYTDPYADPHAEPPSDPYADPDGGFPLPEDLLPVDPGPTQPDTFAG